MDTNVIHTGDALAVLQTLPSSSINCVVTSPPYFGLRDYGHEDQIGLEPTPREYVEAMVAVFAEVQRVLTDNGTCWINLGDSFARDEATGHPSPGQNGMLSYAEQSINGARATKQDTGLPRKSLMGIPWRVAFALQDYGWLLRSDIVWSKPNAMPESVTDRPTRAHEYIFLLTKQPRYWYDADAIKTAVQPHSIKRQGRAVSDAHKLSEGAPGQRPHSFSQARANVSKQDGVGTRQYAGFNERYDGQAVPLANARSVWTIATSQTRDAHFATFPYELARRCIVAGCPVGGVVLDPFMGSGTTALVARAEGRQYVGVELNPEYVAIAEKRLAEPYTLPMLFESEAS